MANTSKEINAGVRASPEGAQYVTPNSKIYYDKVKMCRFSSGNWFFCTRFVQLAMAGKEHNTVCAPPKKSVINCT